MSWTLRLSYPIALDNGEVLLTLRDVRKFILALPEQDLRYAKWQTLAGSLLTAAHTGRADLINIATERLRQALLTPPFAPVRLAGNDTPTEKPPAPSIKRRRQAKQRAIE